MNTFLIPTDFSETSKNAARFAANLANTAPDVELILFAVPDRIDTGSDGTPLDSDEKATHTIMKLAMESVKTELSGITDAKITTVVEEAGHFVDSLNRYVRHHNIQMVIMGITGASRLEKVFVGSNTLKLVDSHTVPVMIVPPDSIFKGAKNIMMISDFKNVDKTIPLHDIKSVLNLFGCNLHVVNVNAEHYVQLTQEYQAESNRLQEMLAQYNPEFYFIRMYNFMDALNQFVIDKDIDLIITIPKHHSFLSHFLKTTHTTRLAYQSNVPIIAIHS
jgi:nucleotide-binding universal stress UspA family protein